MKKDSQKFKELKKTVKETPALFAELTAVLQKHGHAGVRVRSLGLESASPCPGGAPRVPVRVNGPNGPVTIYVCV